MHPFEEVLALQRPNYVEEELKVGERTLDVYLAPFSDHEQGGVLIVLHDMTEQHRNEERRKEFVANVSHELRTPLTNVRSYAETLRDAAGDIPQETSNNFLDIIITETDRMTHIVQELLTLSRLDAGDAELILSRFPFGEAIESVVRANALNAKQRGHELTYIPQESLPLIVGDRSRLEQVMINVIGNAIKYTPPGSEIIIELKRKGKFVYVSVADNGPGIPDEAKPHVFDMFYSASNRVADSRRSLGLGLALCKSIIHAHNGEITVADNEPHGAIFTFSVPAGEVELHE